MTPSLALGWGCCEREDFETGYPYRMGRYANRQSAACLTEAAVFMGYPAY